MKKKPYYLFAWLLGEAAFFITIAVGTLFCAERYCGCD